MDERTNIDDMEQYQEKIKELFVELSSEELARTWADTFDVDGIDEKRITIIYHGTESVKLFKKKCRGALEISVHSLFGSVKKIKIVKKKKSNTSHKALAPKTKKNIKALKFFVIGIIFLGIAASVIVVLCNYIVNRNFRETFYITSSIKVDSPIRVIQISDLHSTSYGKNNEALLERISRLTPDIIICTGDIVDSATEDLDYAMSLCKSLAEIAPSYYVYGNNEVESIYGFPLVKNTLDKKFGFDDNNRDESALWDIEDTFEEKLESVGIKVLKNEKDTVRVKNTNVDVYGVLCSNPSAFWPYSGNAFLDYMYEDTDNVKITAVHEPFIFEELGAEYWGDLMIAGHTHGGIMRIPVLGPLYTKEGGIFPERSGAFVYGRYNVSVATLIVNSGLDNSSILRINNQPELVVIDVNRF